MGEVVARVPQDKTPSRVARGHVVLDRVAKTFPTKDGSLEALREISLDVAEREFVTLIGPSGCGKSTLLRIIGGLIDASAGQVALRGRSPQDAQRTKDIGFVFQQPALLPWRTVAGNIELPFEVNKGAGTDRLCSTEEILSLVGLAQFAKAHPYQLSGGMQQRVAIARALIFDPALLLMDEPFGALDAMTRDEMNLELLRVWGETAADGRKTILFVTHSIPEAVLLADRVIVMTSRPGHVAAVFPVPLPRPRAMESRADPRFGALCVDIYAALARAPAP